MAGQMLPALTVPVELAQGLTEPLAATVQLEEALKESAWYFSLCENPTAVVAAPHPVWK